MYMRDADIRSYSENMKMIEIIRPDVKKCYKTPTIRFVRVDEECILAGGSPIQTVTKDPETEGEKGPGSPRGAKQQFLIFDDEVIE